MNDSINRREAIDAIKHVEVHFTIKSTVDFSSHKKAVHEIIDHILDAQEKALSKLPSAEKTGKWICEPHPIWGKLGMHIAKCSECGFSGVTDKWNFCPDCGAKMEGVEDEEEDE